MDLSEPLSPRPLESSLVAQLAVGILPPTRSLSTDHAPLAGQGGLLLPVPTFGFSTSPTSGAFEYESISKPLMYAGGSTDSIHSTSSH